MTQMPLAQRRAREALQAARRATEADRRTRTRQPREHALHVLATTRTSYWPRPADRRHP
ncbi:MAG: hypothetical protein LBJ15_19315 [Comamonas sp.]|jgi:hypothetical protein|uniref:hypothetical protein n=1 Tax=Comamonas sp. TaxID=34028 RepID=UPI00281F8803|nr:hypothetical protein [Comamonas sp.]MDR0216127.1 hypothetical protein [Comamonas sp.]